MRTLTRRMRGHLARAASVVIATLACGGQTLRAGSQDRRDRRPPGRLFRSVGYVSRALRHPEFSEQPQRAEATVRLPAGRQGFHPVAGLRRPWQCNRDPRRAPQSHLHRRGTARAVVRNLQPGRARLHAVEPRAGAHRRRRPGEQHRQDGAPLAGWQGRSVCRASRNHSLQLPHQSAGFHAALVPGRQCRLHGDLVRRRSRSCAGRLRRNGFPRDGARQSHVL